MGVQRTGDFGFGNDETPSNVKAEFYWSRLAYSASMASFGGYGRHGWRGSWSRDYPKADRQFLIAMHRLTRIDGRPTEQVVTLDSDEIFNYPWIYAVQVQNWSFTDAEAKRLREYLLKGGFLMVDDFHGTEDWENFMNGMRQVLPRPSGRGPAEAATRSFTPSTTSTTRCRFPASSMSGPAAPTRRTAISPNGAPSATTRAGLSLPSATTCIWVTHGSGPMTQITRKPSRRWRSAWGWTTSCMA